MDLRIASIVSVTTSRPVTQNRYGLWVTQECLLVGYNYFVAHVFQMMAGATKNSPLTFRGLQSARTADSEFDLQGSGSLLSDLKEFDAKESSRFFDSHDISRVFEFSDSSGRMCTCPVCRSDSLITLSELGQTPSGADEDGYVVPDVQIGATGIVMPGRSQLVRWFKVPVVPKLSESKLHAKATKEGKHHGMFTFFSTFSFETVFFTPCPSTILLAMAMAVGAGYRSFTTLKKAARIEDKAIGLELKVRVHAYKARNTAWEKLFYCSGCGMVHDRDGKRSLPWYSMLQLVHYPEQEFAEIASPVIREIVEEDASVVARAYRVA